MKTAAACAIVVTHNRQELLRECLIALLGQSHPVEKILVIDNASTDGTAAMVARDFPADARPKIQVLSLAQNVGGAGGFHEGLRVADAETEADWFWLLDDDTIPAPDALEQLLAAWERFPEAQKPSLLASKSLWNDGSLHPMNVPQIKLGDAEGSCLAAQLATLSIRTATFVSLLLRRGCVERHGLPLADYFIWGDDTEYSARILQRETGVLVPASVVTHKTATSYGPVEGSAARFYYFVRNNLWMLLWSSAWTPSEKIKMAVAYFRIIWAFLRCTSDRTNGLRSIGRGFSDALTRRPRR